MGEKRPAKRKGLERHIESHLGRNLEPGQLETLMSQLERDGVLVFNDKNKVEYRLPRRRSSPAPGCRADTFSGGVV